MIYFSRIRNYIFSYNKRSARKYKLTPLWEACLLQTYFANSALVIYFVVFKSIKAPNPAYSTVLTKLEKELFKRLKKDYKDMKYDLKKQAIVI